MSLPCLGRLDPSIMSLHYIALGDRLSTSFERMGDQATIGKAVFTLYDLPSRVREAFHMMCSRLIASSA